MVGSILRFRLQQSKRGTKLGRSDTDEAYYLNKISTVGGDKSI